MSGAVAPARRDGGAAGGATTHTESCRECGAALVYLEQARSSTCAVCGREDMAHVVCPQGHYVCDACHGSDFLGRLTSLLDSETSTSPREIAESLMADPQLPMLGCEHAHIAAGALMRALENSGTAGVTAAYRREALERTARQAVGAYCGLTGVCGVVPALGACFSVLVGARCGRGPETEATMRLVARLVSVTADHARPGCCKAYVRAGVRETESFLEEHLGIPSGRSARIVCVDADRHPHGCRGPGCEWHADHSPPISDPAEEAEMSTAPATPDEPAYAGTSAPAQQHYDRFFQSAYADGVLDEKTKILISLGASLASGCAP